MAICWEIRAWLPTTPRGSRSVRQRVLGFALGCLLLWVTSPAIAQQTTVSSPLTRASQGYSEYMGVRWGVNFPGGFFRFGGPPPANAPPGLARFGTGFNSGNTNGYFNFYAGQSSQAGLNSGTSNLTLGNGQPGGLFEGRQVPFVLGVVPVVGGFAGGGFSGGLNPQLPVPYAPRSAFEDRLARLRASGVDLTAPRESSSGNNEAAAADDRDLPAPVASPQPVHTEISPPLGSVETIAAQRAAAVAAEQAKSTEEIHSFLARAERAVAEGKQGAARVYLQMALRRAVDPQRAEIQARLDSLSP